jgi:hypothetical protein
MAGSSGSRVRGEPARVGCRKGCAVAKLEVEASFTLATSQAPGPLWLSLAVSTADGLGADLRFPNPAAPDLPWPVKGIVLTSEGLGGVTVPIKGVRHVFQSVFDYPGIFLIEIAADWEGTATLAEIKPLAIGIIVEWAGDRGQTLALASQSMHLDRH